MKKKKLILIIYIPAFILGIVYLYIMDKIEEQEIINAPKISFEKGLKGIDVKNISFERGGLYLNKILYNTNGISSHSRVHHNKSTIFFRDIKPPFIIRKKVNNDTLEIVRKNERLYLLVTEEMRYTKDKD